MFDNTRFNVANVSTAKSIILTGDTDKEGRQVNAEERWKLETPYMADMAKSRLGEYTTIIDYGCGIGRMAKPMTSDTQYMVGVDSSPSMRALACVQAKTENFAAVPVEIVKAFPMQFDAAISIWVLQHIPQPDLDEAIRTLFHVMKPGAKLFIANSNVRYIPDTSQFGWFDDGISVKERLLTRFSCLATGTFDDNYILPRIAETSFWGVYTPFK
jgi:2-polyprenyl-3-methyl-5-hydroxy-6-metoxy-1,4-benzoquinol methylase